MSQALLMRIIALENKIADLEDRFNAAFEMDPDESLEETVEEILEATEPVNVPFVHGVNTDEPVETTPYWIEQHGASWWRVFGPDGEITEKGIRRWEAQTLADDLNERHVEKIA